MSMPADSRRTYIIEASANDAYDALVRLMTDAQRFGLELNEVVSLVSENADVSIRMRVSSFDCIDCVAVQARFSRHPTITHVSAVEARAIPAAPVLLGAGSKTAGGRER